MKKSILAACVAALSFAGCTERTEQTATAVETPVSVQRLATLAPSVGDAGNYVAKAPEVTPPVVEGLGLPHEQPGVDHLARAQSLKEVGDLKGAVTEARRAVFSNPTDDETLTFTARLASMAGQHGIAADAWAAVSELRPDDATTRVQEARCRLRAHDLVGATVAAQDAISRDPGAPEAHQALGRAALNRGEIQQAIDAFEKVISLSPDHGFALNNLGLAYLRANENEKAVDVLGKAAGLLPQVAYVHNNLGIALERVGRTEEAKSAYLTATSLSPKYVKARVNMNRVAKAQVPVDPTDVETPTESPSDE